MKIKELHLLSDNIIETELFYNNVLNVKTEDKSPNTVSFNVGSTKIIFIQTKPKQISNLFIILHLIFLTINSKRRLSG